MRGRVTEILVLFSLVAGSAALSADGPDIGRAGDLAGHWFDPSHNGQGFAFEVLENGDGLVFWFTYDPTGKQIWILGQGRMDGNKLEISEALVTSNGLFSMPDPSQTVDLQTWGSISIVFHSCSDATLDYSGPPEFGQGSRQLVRLSVIDGRPCNDRRTFRLGFTPLPAELPEPGGQALLEIYDRLRGNGDLIAHHFDDGVPWPEAAAGGGFESYHPNLREDWQFRKAMTPAGHQVYVAITPISIGRDQLAPYRGSAPDTPLENLGPPWANADFDDPLVATAFLNHAINTIEFFHPDYLAIGIEVNLLMNLAPEKWPAYLELHRAAWSQLRARYPSLPIFVTMTAGELLEGLTAADPVAQDRALADMEPYTDLLGISFYPFLSALGTDRVPAEVFRRIDQLSDKPKAIAETGFPAQFQQLNFVLGEVVMPFTINGSRQSQADYIGDLLAAADRFQFRFVVNFIAQDYDAFCDAIDCADFNRLWQDTGLWNENGNGRPALAVWRQNLSREVVK